MDTISPSSQMRDSWEGYFDVEDSSDSEDEDFDAIFGSIRSLHLSEEEEEEEEVLPGECEICLGVAYMPSPCCKLYFCDDCMSTYINSKVNEGHYRIECPGSNCTNQLHYNVLEVYLSPAMHKKFVKFFTDGNSDPTSKSCPSCGNTHSIDPKELKKSKRKLRSGLQITCPHCQFVWCFLCQAPFHTGVTCKEYRKGDGMVSKWAKEWTYGQFNAQKCPKCKIYIQKKDGCDHMTCSKCKTDFCYRCGGRYIKTKYFGNHLSHLSVFGCKYRFMPDRPVLRRLIRGTAFAGLLTGGVVLAGLGLALGAALVGTSVIILPGYGAFRLRKHMVRKRQRKMLQAHREAMGRVYDTASLRSVVSSMTPRDAALRPLWQLRAEQFLTTEEYINIIQERYRDRLEEEIEEFISEQSRPETLLDDSDEEYDMDLSEIFMLRVPEDDPDNDESENCITTTEFKEILNADGYPTLMANIVTRSAVATPPPDYDKGEDLDSTADGTPVYDEDRPSVSDIKEIPTCEESTMLTSGDTTRTIGCESPLPDYDQEDDQGHVLNVRL